MKHFESAYTEQAKVLKTLSCPKCRGYGTVDDMGPGDISYNECEGSDKALREAWKEYNG